MLWVSVFDGSQLRTDDRTLVAEQLSMVVLESNCVLLLQAMTYSLIPNILCDFDGLRRLSEFVASKSIHAHISLDVLLLKLQHADF